MRNRLILLSLFAFSSLLFETTAAADLLVAASANASHAAKELASAFEAETGHRVRVSVAASGTIYSQLVNGAPFDVFLSADTRYPRELEQAGFAEPGSRQVYAVGRLVVWTSLESPLDVMREGIRGLLQDDVRKVAIANPRHAPYGEAAIEALEHFEIYDQIRSKLVLGENLAQVAQFIESGAADAGMIAFSQVQSPGLKERGRYWLVPETAHSPIEQAAVIVRGRGGNTQLARQFLDFVLSPAGRKILARFGYVFPPREETGNPRTQP